MLHLPRSPRFIIALAALLSLAPVCSGQTTHHHKFSSDLRATKASDTVRVIIQYHNDPSDAELTQIRSLGGVVAKRLHSIKSTSVQISRSALDALEASPNVAYVSIDRPLRARQAVGSIATTGEYTTQPINAQQAWQAGYDGTGIGVAVIDSGITPVDDLSSGNGPGYRIVYSQSFVPSAPGDATDHFGHGTHVAGLIAGNGTDSTGKPYTRTFSGVAPNANLINLRVLDENGAGTDSAVISALETAIALKDTYNIRVINLSLGRPIYESYALDPLCQEVEAAWQAGIFVVVAAGNDGRDLALSPEGYGTIEAPGNDPFALTVGATNSNNTPTVYDDVMASYSSKGPTFIDHLAKPDLVAPGNLVTSLMFPGDALQAENPILVTLDSFYMKNGGAVASTNYMPLSGTSMSAAVTSGAAALLLQARPSITPDQAKALLMLTANKNALPQTSSVTDPTTGTVYVAHNDILTVGAGYLDIGAAIQYAPWVPMFMPAGDAMSPTVAYDRVTGGLFLLKGDNTALWGANIMLAAQVVYGQSAFGRALAPANATWGFTAAWGASNIAPFTSLRGSDSTALWGADSTALWGADTALWGADTALWGANSTALWGADSTALWGADSTALWGANSLSASDATALWGADSTALWGASAVSGQDTALWGADTALWGASTPQAASALWGADSTALWGADSTALWGASAPVGQSAVWSTSVPFDK